MENQPLDRVVEAITVIPSIMHRKVHRHIFRVALDRIGEGISPHHRMILKALHYSGEMSCSEIAEALAIAKPQITVCIDKLKLLGLVERRTDARDRRKVNISLTRKGLETMEECDRLTKSRIKDALSSLDDQELARLADSFEYIAKTLGNL